MRLPIDRLAAAALLLLVSACCPWNTRLDHPTDLPRVLEAFHNADSEVVLVAAHRGMHHRHPENSLAAIQEAIDRGVDIVEIDVRETRDGVLVLMHDETVDRTTNGSGRVLALSYDQIRQLRLKRLVSVTNEPVPSLSEALSLAKGRVMLDLDVKSASAEGVAEVVQQADCLDQVIFFSSDLDFLARIGDRHPEAILMPRAHSPEDVALIIERLHPPIIHIDDGFFTPEVVRTIKMNGARVWINALDRPDRLALVGLTDAGYGSLIRGGANVLQTDRPRLMLAYLYCNSETLSPRR